MDTYKSNLARFDSMIILTVRAIEIVVVTSRRRRNSREAAKRPDMTRNDAYLFLALRAQERVGFPALLDEFPPLGRGEAARLF